MGIKKVFKKSNLLFNLAKRIKNHRDISKQKKFGDEYLIKQKWKHDFGYEIDLMNPQTLNEKIQWLKLNDRKEIYTIWADKYAARQYIEKEFGSEYLVPLFYYTDNPKDINPININVFPCAIKANHSSASCHLYREPSEINWKQLRRDCKTWLKIDYYAASQEWQYKNIKRYIIVEKLLLTKEGKIPNDYKLHFIEGELAFIYCAIDREGDNYRQIYDKDWNLLPFSWDATGTYENNHKPISKPSTFKKMVEIGMHFAKKMHYVRVDFYDVDGKLYCGEITLHHGSGFDKFNPPSYDLMYGKKIIL